MQCDLQTSVNHWIFERIRRRLASGGRSVSAPTFRLLKLCACAGGKQPSEHLTTILIELCVLLWLRLILLALARTLWALLPLALPREQVGPFCVRGFGTFSVLGLMSVLRTR